MLQTTVILAILAVSSLVIASISMIFGIVALVKVLAMEKSTHSVQYVPINDEIDKANEEYLKKSKETPWATSDQSLKEQQKLFTEDLEELMPDLASSEEDKELYSF